MPNWCTNEVEIHADPEQLSEIKTQLQTDEEAFDFNTLIPMPEELTTIVRGRVTIEVNGEKVRPHAWREGADKEPQPVDTNTLIKKYGAPDWYEWACVNWGTKWNASNSEVEEGNGYLSYTFETAWSPPQKICEALREKYPDADINWFYREDGMQLAGYL